MSDGRTGGPERGDPAGTPGERPGDDREERGDGEAEGAAPARGGRARKAWLALVAALLVAIGVLYVWKLVAVSQVRTEMAAQRDSLHARALRALDDRTGELLRLSAAPLGWTMRGEMLRRNYDQANRFLNEFVRESGVERVVIGVPSDSILLATDKRIEGSRFSDHFPGDLLGVTEPRVARADGGAYRVTVPILGPTRTLGVLVLDFRPERVPLLPTEGEAPDAATSAGDTAEPSTGRPDGPP